MMQFLKKIRYFPILLPVVFVILFLGLMPVKYDVVLHTDNIKGEGICITHFCNPVSFSPFYESGFYFGSELKKATIAGYHYDVNLINLDISDVSEFDIVGLDSYIWGIHLKHYDGGQIMDNADRIETEDVVLTNTGSALHGEVKDPAAGIAFNLHKQMIPALFWVIYFAVILTASILLTLLVDRLSKRWPMLPLVLTGISGIIVALLAGMFFCGSLPYSGFKYFFLNWLFLYALSVAFGAVTLPWIGTIATMGFTTFWFIANYFVIALRGKPVMPADLKAMGTAAEVMGGYFFKPNWQMILGVLVVILYAVALEYFRTCCHHSLRDVLLRQPALLRIQILLPELAVPVRAERGCRRAHPAMDRHRGHHGLHHLLVHRQLLCDRPAGQAGDAGGLESGGNRRRGDGRLHLCALLADASRRCGGDSLCGRNCTCVETF